MGKTEIQGQVPEILTAEIAEGEVASNREDLWGDYQEYVSEAAQLNFETTEAIVKGDATRLLKQAAKLPVGEAGAVEGESGLAQDESGGQTETVVPESDIEGDDEEKAVEAASEAEEATEEVEADNEFEISDEDLETAEQVVELRSSIDEARSNIEALRALLKNPSESSDGRPTTDSEKAAYEKEIRNRIKEEKDKLAKLQVDLALAERKLNPPEDEEGAEDGKKSESEKMSGEAQRGEVIAGKSDREVAENHSTRGHEREAPVELSTELVQNLEKLSTEALKAEKERAEEFLVDVGERLSGIAAEKAEMSGGINALERLLENPPEASDEESDKKVDEAWKNHIKEELGKLRAKHEELEAEEKKLLKAQEVVEEYVAEIDEILNEREEKKRQDEQELQIETMLSFMESMFELTEEQKETAKEKGITSFIELLRLILGM